MNDDKFKDLNFTLTKDIWLEFDEDSIKGWVTHKPKNDNGYMSKGATLLYSHTYIFDTEIKEYSLNFIEIPLGDLPTKGVAEFFIEEVDKFVNSGVFKLIDKTNISSCILTPNGILIDRSNILNTKDISFVTGLDKAYSNYLMIGTKIPLSKIVDSYIENYKKQLEDHS